MVEAERPALMERIKEWDIQMEADGMFPTPEPPAYQRYMPRQLTAPTGSAPTSYYYDRQTAHHPSPAEEEWTTTVAPPTGDMEDEDYPDALAVQMADSASERTKAFNLARQLLETLRPMRALPLQAAIRQINSTWNWRRHPTFRLQLAAEIKAEDGTEMDIDPSAPMPNRAPTTYSRGRGGNPTGGRGRFQVTRRGGY